MANKMLFIPYLRKGYSRYIVEEDNLGKPINGGKTSTSINFRVEFDTKSALDNNQEETVSIDKEFIIAGPGEITNLDFNQIVDYSNELKHKYAVAYLANRYLSPIVRNFFVSNNIKVDEDAFALSELIQFIFRTRIRDNEEIYVYIPSKRMRLLLKKWLKEKDQ